MSWLRYTLALGLAALIVSAAVAKAEQTPKMTVPAVKIDSKAQEDAERKMEAAKKEAEHKKEQQKEQMHKQQTKTQQMQKEQTEKAEEMKKQQMKKAEQVQKEAGKGSEQGQAMREEHRKKWWKFWGSEPAAE